MSHETDASSHEIDASVPHSARIWNYWLGGKDNFPVDREAGEAFLKLYPGMREAARSSRAVLGRAVRYLVTEAGTRQFLDVGTGLPTQDNTHEVAQRHAPDARIVYVDNDPLVLAHARALLTSAPEGRTAYIHADVREPSVILEEARKTLDLGAPVALILMGIMGHIPDDEEATGIVRALMAALPSGSHLLLGDGTNVLSEDNVKAHDEYNQSGAVPYIQRSPEQLARFFEGLDLVEPGLVMGTRWRPDPADGEPRPVDGYCGVARKL
jgi:hypothetical protein